MKKIHTISIRTILYLIFLRWFFSVTLKAQRDPVERLFVSIEGNVNDFLDDVDQAADEASDRLEDVSESGKKMGGSLKGSAALAGAAFGVAAGVASKLLDVVLNLAVAIPQLFASLAREAVAANAQFETFASQFETLLGSSGAAQERLEELARFGVETPFELPEVVEASRTLEIFGGAALATGDNLRLIGDLAAGVNQPFQDVAFWIGRMFDALQNGQPFGEAAMRLQEMGILSGGVRRRMEQMAKSGEDGAEVFNFFSEQVGDKFAGNMERLSGTFQGVMSNLADFRGMLVRVGGEPLFEEIRQSALDFLELLNDNQDTIIDVAKGVGRLAASVVRLAREGFGKVDIKSFLAQIQSFVDWLSRTTKAGQALIAMWARYAEAVSPLTRLLGALLSVALAPVINAFRGLTEILSRLDEALIAGAQVLALSTAGWKGLLATLAPIGEVIAKIGGALLALAQGDFARAGELAGQAVDRIQDGLIDVDAGIKAMEDSLRDSVQTMDDLTSLDTARLSDQTDGGGGTAEPEPEDVGLPSEDKLADMLDGLTNQMIDATEDRNEKLAELEKDHADRVLDIMADANDKRMEIDERANEALEKLAADTEKERLEIISSTREQLAKLADDTNRELSSRRRDFNRDELRDTEDHLKDMRRLEEDFLLNLEDAVRARDAGAIVDLQRRFATESQRKEEDFETDQSRQREDFDQELGTIRENEARQREEILAGQAQALEDLRVHEEEKRLEIEIRRQEDLERLQENLNERLMRENENYAQRQQALDEALQKQLEAIAQKLADEEGVTEEGARAILEKFNEYFGVGGEIDKLMENFARRRQIRADIKVDFESSAPSEPEGGAPPPPPPSSGQSGPFHSGGTLFANRPTTARFGEVPELVSFQPLSQLTAERSSEPQRMVIEMTGSAPPGIGTAERDAIAGVMVSALQDAGSLVTEG